MIRKEIEFNKGAILRKEMLEEMYNFPKRELYTFYSAYSDGILYGLRLEKQEHKIMRILPGAIKFHGEIYIQENEIVLSDELDKNTKMDREYFLCLRESKCDLSSSIKEYKLNICLEDTISEEAFPLAKVQYHLGALYDLCNKRDTKIDVLGCYAAKDGFKYALPVNRLVLELKDILCEKGLSKCILDYLILRIMNEEDSMPVSFINMYIQEYNSLNESDKLSIVNDEMTPLQALIILKEAIIKYKIVSGGGGSFTNPEIDSDSEEPEEEAYWD